MFSILYVDDEPGLLDIGKIFLEKKGNLSVDTVLSAQDALTILHETSYDCIVSDYQMPRMDGLEFLKEVRSTWGHIPFILFTGKGREEVVIEALNNGVDFYLQKGGEPRPQFAELEHKIRLAIERRITGGKLRNSERRFLDIINFLPDPTFAIDLDGKVIAWNHAIEDLTGVKKDILLGTGDFSYSLYIFGERKPILIDLVIRDITELSSQYQYIQREGSRLVAERYAASLNGGKGAHLWITSSPLYDSDGNISGAIESIRDISVRKKAEEELRAAFEQLAAAEEELRQQYEDLARSEVCIRNNERRLSDIINFLPDATFAIDLNGIVIAWNNAMEEITGVLRSEIIGTGDYSYSLPMWGTRRPVLIDSVLKEDKLVESFYPSVIRSGEKVITEAFAPQLYQGKGAYVWFIAAPLYDANGVIVGAIESIRDITDRKRDLDDLKVAYEQLAATEEELRQQYRDLAWGESRIREDERFISDVLSSIQDGIIILDRNLQVIRVNEAMENLFPKSGTSAGKTCFERYHNRDVVCDGCPALETLKTGLPKQKTISIRDAEGKKSPVKVFSYPLYDSETETISGVIEYLCGIAELYPRTSNPDSGNHSS